MIERKLALITGSGKARVGNAVAEALAEAAFDIAVHYRTSESEAREAEAFVCLTLFLRRFEFRALRAGMGADSGVSSRPSDLVDVELSLRD